MHSSGSILLSGRGGLFFRLGRSLNEDGSGLAIALLGGGGSWVKYWLHLPPGDVCARR